MTLSPNTFISIAPLLLSLIRVKISLIALERALISIAQTPRTQEAGRLRDRLLYRLHISCLESTEKFSEDVVGDGESEREASECDLEWPLKPGESPVERNQALLRE